MPEVRSALIELTIARTKEFLRETEAIFWVFGFPLMLTLALGFAFRERPPERVPIGIVAGPQAEQRLQILRRSPVLQPRIYDAATGQQELRRGKISLLLEGESAPLYRFDPTRPEARTARVEADLALQRAAGRRDVLSSRDVHMREQGSRYIDFLVPGLLGMNLMSTGMWGMGFTIVNARMKKLLKRLIATPMKRSDFLLAQFFFRLLFLIAEVVVLMVFAWLIFDVVISGSVLLFALICFLGGLAFTGLGLLTASRVKTLEAVSGLMNLIMVPMWICSGVFFSYERFPDSVKPLIRALPLTALNDALRDVMNDSLGLAQVMPELLNLAVWTVVTYLVGLKIFRWQ